MTDLLVKTQVKEEITEQDIYYFAATDVDFLIYDRVKEGWYSLKDNRFFLGSFESVKQADGIIHIKCDQPKSYGRWGHSLNLDDILDFYNSGEYLIWIKQ